MARFLASVLPLPWAAFSPHPHVPPRFSPPPPPRSRSYRVAADADFAQKLAMAIEAAPCKNDPNGKGSVFLDRHCLNNGEDWEVGYRFRRAWQPFVHLGGIAGAGGPSTPSSPLICGLVPPSIFRWGS